MGSVSSASRFGRALTMLLIGAVLLAGCGGPADHAPQPSVTSASPSTPIAVPLDHRPLLDVPRDVRPPGFVDPPAGSGLQRYLDQEVGWAPCRGTLECARVSAPLDYADPDGQAITLSVARRPASADRVGSLFVNPGGPGGSGVDYAAQFSADGLEAYDIVGWDPRGVGESTPVRCFGDADLARLDALDQTPDDQEERSALLQGNRDFGASCLAGSGRLLEHVSTEDSARDLDLLRQLLGEPKINFYGASYGSTLGLTYAILFPKGVGRMILDGGDTWGPLSDIQQAKGFERSLRAWAGWVATKPAYGLGAGEDEVLIKINSWWDDLDAEPAKVGGRLLSQSEAVYGTLFPLYYDDSQWPALADALASAINEGDASMIMKFADSFLGRDDSGRYDQRVAAFPAVACSDVPINSINDSDAQIKRASEQAPMVGPVQSGWYSCGLWPVPRAPERPPIPTDLPPILVIGSTGDSATPYEWAQATAKALPGGILLTRKGYGHTAYTYSPCIRTEAARFITTGATATTHC